MRAVRHRLSLAAVAVTLCCASLTAYGESVTTFDDIVELDVKKPEKFNLSTPTVIRDSQVDGAVRGVEELPLHDKKNLTLLWDSVIANNSIVQYGLKQLATPPELRYAQSSIMSRTIGGLLSGAAMVPYAFGASTMAMGTTSVGANMVDRAMVRSKKIDPTKLPSDTELVELSGLVQRLQSELVESYFQYKSSLTRMEEVDHQLSRMNAQYQKVKKTPSALDDLWVEQLYKNLSHERFLARQKAKYHYLKLERLAGTDTMNTIRFTQHGPSDDAMEAVALRHVPPAEEATTSSEQAESVGQELGAVSQAVSQKGGKGQ